MNRFLLVALPFFALSVGCARQPTEAVVIVNADQTVFENAEALRVEVEGAGSFAGPFTVAVDETVRAPRFPFFVTLAPTDEDPTRVFRVQATALDAVDAEIASQQIVGSYTRGASITLTLNLIVPVGSDGGVSDGGLSDGGIDSGS